MMASMEIESRRSAPGVRAAGAVLSATLLCGAPAVASDTILQPAEVVMSEGQLVPNIGTVVPGGVGPAVINSSGFWVVEVTTDNVNPNSDRVLVKPGGIVAREGTPLAQPPGAILDDFLEFVLADDGSMAFRHVLGPGDWGVYLDDELIVRSGDDFQDASLAPATYDVVAPLHLNEAGQLLARAEVTQFAGAGSAFVVYELTAPGVLSETVVVYSGQVLPAEMEVVGVVTGGRYSADLAADGRVLFTVGTSSVGRVVYLADGAFLTDVSPPGGLGIAPRVGLADDGGQIIRTSSTIYLDGEVVTQVDDPEFFEEAGDGTFHTVEFPQVADGGRTTWLAQWISSTGPGEGLFVDGQLLVQSGVTRVDGHLVTSLSVPGLLNPLLHNLDVSSDGRWLLFGAQLEGLGESVVRVFLGPWTSLGEGLNGDELAVPKLTGVGPLTAGSDNALELRHAAPSSALLLVTGLSETPQPFFGGTLVPSPDFLRFGTTDAAGAFSFPFFLPGAAVGLSFVSQVWVRDPGGPAGLAASNAVRGVTQP